MLIIRPLPGQERGNTEMLVGHGAAVHLDRDRDLPAVVASLFANTALLGMMADRAKALGKPDAARNIASAVLANLPPEEVEE
jgi:processive 1,2-diacylglycerol beta-glucosyltransferase